MRLTSTDGPDTFNMTIEGYQYPDAKDPYRRYSWHLITGSATDATETWAFRYPALTCDESPLIATWLRRTAAWIRHPETQPRPDTLTFTEPNLAFAVHTTSSGDTGIDIALDLEFRAPRHRRTRGAGQPTQLVLTVPETDLLVAASDWDRETRQYPDLTPRDRQRGPADE